MSVVDTVVAYKFIKILSTPWKKTDAYKLGIIDDKGTVLKKRKDLKTSEEKKAYTIFHTLIQACRVAGDFNSVLLWDHKTKT